MDLGHWKLGENVQYKPNAFGFIYLIRNLVTQKKYIGKKQCITTYKRPPLKGKKNKRHELKETDWKSYTSSSAELNADIEKIGKQNFEFIILHFCGSKWELGYREIKEQLNRDVILREDYYNGILNVRIGSPPRNFIDN